MSSYLPYALPLGSLVLALPYLRQRLQLSRAKHRSLAGHSRMAKRLASWLPGYAHDEARFFDCDGAPAEVVAQRRAAFDLLCAGFAERYAKTLALTAQAREGLADLRDAGGVEVADLADIHGAGLDQAGLLQFGDIVRADLLQFDAVLRHGLSGGEGEQSGNCRRLEHELS